jgi:hypothetical protein
MSLCVAESNVTRKTGGDQVSLKKFFFLHHVEMKVEFQDERFDARIDF